MTRGGSYVLHDSNSSYEFPSPVTSWAEQPLGDGLNGVPAINGYRLHTWRLTGLDEDEMALLTGFMNRQQLGTATGLEIETDPYNPECTTDAYRTEVFTDVQIKAVSRERGFGFWQNVSVVFEILVS